MVFIFAVSCKSQDQTLLKTYYDSGELYSEVKKNDREKGIIESNIIYYKDGTMKGSVIQLTTGDSVYTDVLEMYSNGNVKTNYRLLNGLKDGSYLSNYDDGATKEYGIFENGKESGLFVTYYPNKMYMSKINWNEGVLDGESIFYYPNGDVFQFGKYKDGKKVGEWVSYDNQGEINEKNIYDDNGILTDS
jgi:antitoxin component YwqK of YwqJK toxin-antitoxin module